MPFSNFTLDDPSASPKLVTSFTDIDTLTLSTVTAYLKFPTGTTILYWVRIALITADNFDNIISVLAEGYLTNINTISWTGKIKLEPTMQLSISATGDGNVPIHLAYLTERS